MFFVFSVLVLFCCSSGMVEVDRICMVSSVSLPTCFFRYVQELQMKSGHRSPRCGVSFLFLFLLQEREEAAAS